MTLLLRTGLAVGAAALAVVSSQTHPAPPRTDLLAADAPADHPRPAYAGLAALSVGGLGLFARRRR